jgi:hypothetical protein
MIRAMEISSATKILYGFSSNLALIEQTFIGIWIKKFPHSGPVSIF